MLKDKTESHRIRGFTHRYITSLFLLVPLLKLIQSDMQGTSKSVSYRMSEVGGKYGKFHIKTMFLAKAAQVFSVFFLSLFVLRRGVSLPSGVSRNQCVKSKLF